MHNNYFCTKDGYVWSYLNNKWGLRKKPLKLKAGNMILYTKTGKNIKSHTSRIIWEYFNGPILEGLVINHLDCNRDNNSLENLECVTRSRNIQYAYDLKRKSAVGSKNGQAKLDEAFIPAIRVALSEGVPIQDIAQFYKVSPATIYDIKKGKTWRHV